MSVASTQDVINPGDDDEWEWEDEALVSLIQLQTSNFSVPLMQLVLILIEETLAEVFYNVNYANVNYSVKNSTVDCNCKYLLFLQDFFLQIKTKTVKKCQYS